MATSESKPGPNGGASLAESSIHLARPEVDISKLMPAFFQFVVQVAMIHKLLFGVPLVITEGSEHTLASPVSEGVGRAVVLSAEGLDPDEIVVFFTVLIWACGNANCSITQPWEAYGERSVTVRYHGE